MPVLFLEDKSDTLREAAFTARTLFHTLFNPENIKGFAFPAGYEQIVRLTRLIHEDRDRNKKSTPAPAPTKGAAGKVIIPFFPPKAFLTLPAPEDSILN